MKPKATISLYLSLMTLLFLAIPYTAYADTLRNDNYNIDTENVSVDSILHSTVNNIIKPILPIQTKDNKSYQTESDFANSTLSFTSGSDTINFGNISSTDPVLRQSQFNLSNTI